MYENKILEDNIPQASKKNYYEVSFSDWKCLGKYDGINTTIQILTESLQIMKQNLSQAWKSKAHQT